MHVLIYSGNIDLAPKNGSKLNGSNIFA